MLRIEEIAKNFLPAERETQIYKAWLEQGAFSADADSDKPSYTIVMPPPNITGQLHMGHALTLSYQDILIRQKRMAGFETLYLPGTDHASIATEMKIVEQLRKEGLDKREMGREAFLERAWQWKELYGGRIEEQLARFGVSCDWNRLRFTLDEGLSAAVRKVFVDLYRRDLIYRGERIVNWCPECRTALSDAEVDHEEQDSLLYYLRYPIKDSDAFLEVATTRPETMLGDTALAVHPEDERYLAFLGRSAIIPVVGREIPIVADNYVERDFGSGVVKITPAHDPNDFELAQRHELPLVDIFDDAAVVNESGGAFAGLSRYEARKRMVEELEKGGYFVRSEKLLHNVGCCSRCSTTLEPRVSLQWFVSMKTLAEPAIRAVREGEIRFYPSRFEKLYFNWMENIRDWCISRQLWWGHRIPAWYCRDCGLVTVDEHDPLRCAHCASEKIEQDPDSLDTWFSSALWPFSTLGWPEETKDMAKFYPTDCLVTGYDIITFWVSRMIFSALDYVGKIPFRDVFINGLVRDEQGRKMSKSLGNGIDPLDEIERSGTDALRFSLLSGGSPGGDLRYSTQKTEAGRNFVNKVWNAYRFVAMNLDEEMNFDLLAEGDYSAEDLWILDSLQNLIAEVTEHFRDYEPGLALAKIYSFLWDDYCDWYIEMVKVRLRTPGKSRLAAQAALARCLTDAVKLLHPFMPYFTEDIYRGLPHEEGQLVRAAWPTVEKGLYHPENAARMRLLMEIVRGVRNVKAEYNLPARETVRLLLRCEDEAMAELLLASGNILHSLAAIASVERIKNEEELPAGALALSFPFGAVYLPLAEYVDLKSEISRLEQELLRMEQERRRAMSMLANESFSSRAPAAVVEKEREKVGQYEAMETVVRQRMSQLKKIISES